jgi:integrase
MATIERRKKKDGTCSYRIKVSCGYDSDGRYIRRTKTWTPPKEMSEAKAAKEAARLAAEFEKEIQAGFEFDNRLTFAEYANYVIEMKEFEGVKKRTIDLYKDLTRRVNAVLGHRLITDIRPEHLNAFYRQLAEEGSRITSAAAVAKIDLKDYLKEHKLSGKELARRAGISSATVSSASRGQVIRSEKAEAIASALDVPVDELFELTRDMRPLSATMINQYHRFISTVLGRAVKERKIPYNPAEMASPPKVKTPKRDYYQPEEMDEILEALEDAPLKWKAITYLFIDTGCRRGEIAGLKWNSVDLKNGLIDISEALLSSHGEVYVDAPKSEQSVRVLRIAPETVDLLKEWQREQTLERLKCGDRWENSGFVFTGCNGRRLHPDSITTWLREWSAQIGLPHLHPHAFRHTAASNMIATGTDIVTASSELGHSNANVTASIYAHPIAMARAKAAEARGSVFKRRTERKKALDEDA